MSGIALVMMGLWLIGVGWHGNTATAMSDAFSQKAVVPWLVAVLILYALYRIEALKTPIKAISTLAVLAILLKQWPDIEKSSSELKQQFSIP